MSYSATGELFDPDFYRRSRGWSQEDWATGEDSLRERGWLGSNELTEAGRELRRGVEGETDRLSLPPWEALGEETAAAGGHGASLEPGDHRRRRAGRGRSQRPGVLPRRAFRLTAVGEPRVPEPG
ncbi:MAG: helix-turn-helix domain-containing protein [Actinomycetota bacterium]